MAIGDEDVNICVKAEESLHSTPNYYHEELARVLQELGNRAATGSLKRILAFANQEFLAPGNVLDNWPESVIGHNPLLQTTSGPSDLGDLQGEDGGYDSRPSCSFPISMHHVAKKAKGEGHDTPRVLVEGEFLPKELLHNIFARLSVVEIIRLRCLSKEWTSPISDFQQECDKAYPKLFALISKNQGNSFWVRIFDIKLNRWHAFQIPGGHSKLRIRHGKSTKKSREHRSVHPVDITAASEDGGLVCFVSTFKTPSKQYPSGRSFHVTVTNPLTNNWKKLPLVKMSVVRMVQITTDAQTRNYKVLLVGHSSAGFTAQVYDPTVSTGHWTTVNKSPHFTVFEYGYNWGDFRCSPKRDRPMAYTSATGQLFDLYPSCPWKIPWPARSSHVKSFALQKDRVFVLQRDIFGPENQFRECRYYIVEYQLQLQPAAWVQVGSHRCEPFERPPRAAYKLTLHSCKGFLMVFASLSDQRPYSNIIGWLYDLATSEWRSLPAPPGGEMHDMDDLMCEVRWNVHP